MPRNTGIKSTPETQTLWLSQVVLRHCRSKRNHEAAKRASVGAHTYANLHERLLGRPFVPPTEDALESLYATLEV